MTYYVATTGSDSNSGTQAAPFLTLAKGAAAAHAGDTVIVADGTYGNQGVVSPGYVVTLPRSGTAAAPITFQAANRGKAVLDAGNTATGTTPNGAYSYINLNSQSFIVLQGFVLQHAAYMGIESNASEHDITVRWCEFAFIGNHTNTTQVGADGIYMNAGEKNFIFDGCVFHDIGRTSGNTLHFDHGIYGAATNVTVKNCLFYNMKAGWAIQLSAGATTWLIANNTFVGACTGDGESGQIMWWGANTNITVRNNIFYQPNSAAMASYQATVTVSAFDHNLVFPMTSLGATGIAGLTVGSNQLGVNPLFTDAADFDFSLLPGSPAIGTGLTIPSVTTDINGVPRTAPYSLGAYQGGTAPLGPVISQIATGTLSVTWSTDQPASSVVQYGPSSAYGSTTPVDPNLVTAHSVAIPGLMPGTLYHFRCGSTNAQGVQTLSPDHIVTAPTVQ